MSESLKNFHNDFIEYFQTRDKLESNLLACQILLYSTLDPEMEKYIADDSHTNYFDSDKEYVNEFIEKLFSKFEDFTKLIFPDMKKFVDDTINMCKKVMPGHLLKLFRQLYKLSNRIENFNALLFDEFYSFISKTKQKNSEWTPETICKIFALLSKSYEIKTLFDPCIGANRLPHYLSKLRKINPVVTGFDIVPVLTVMSYIDLIKQDIENGIDISKAGLKHKIMCKDMFTHETEELFDLCVCNPPYTKEVSKHDALEFVVKSMTMSKHGIFIFPSNQIRGNIALKVQKELLKVAVIDRVITLGSKVFNGIGAGDICIMVCTNKSLSDNTETVVQNIDYYKYINRVPHSDGDVFKPETEKEFIKIIAKKINAEIIDATETFNWCGQTDLFKLVRSGEKIYQGKDSDIEILKYFTDEEILQNFKNSKHDLSFENIKQKILETEQQRKFLKCLDVSKFEKIRLMSVFNLVKGKSIKTEESNENGKYPYVAAAKINNGIKGYTDFYNFEASEEKPLYTLCTAGDGASGYIFKQKCNFTKAAGIYVLKPLFKSNDINTDILTTQLTNMGFGFSNKINETTLKDIEVYIYRD